MSDNTSGSRFDPRYDPAFQPGYRPEADGRTAVRRPAAQPAMPPAPPAPGQDPVSTVPPVAPETQALDVEEAEPTARRVDPFLIALWAVSALFVVVGISLLSAMANRLDRLSTSGSNSISGSDYYLLQAYQTGAPLLIVLGLATATATLFFFVGRRIRA
ncbi:MAG TPA: hypothetical protein VGC18_03965 [Lacisediminihabitans sp.]|uniref:hypothetical protein n=1 Tax=Lacisediminihabitans sp. TaxID=2787631 RepID=UPI002ED86EC3